MAEIRGCVPGGAAAVDPVAVSTLADDSNQTDGYNYAPTLSISAGAAGGTWSTVGVRTSDDSAVSVTGSTTTTPSATLTAADLTAGEAFRMTSTYTVGSLSDSVTSVVRVAAVGGGGGSFSTVFATDFTASSTGTLSEGLNTIDTRSYDVTLGSGSMTDDANGVRIISANGNFSYFGIDIASLLTDKDKAWRAVFTLDGFTIDSTANVGIAIYSATTPDAAVRAPAAQLRINNAAGTYNQQGLHTTGAVGGAPAFTNAGNTALAGAPASAVVEVYGCGPLMAMRWYDGTTTIPAAAADFSTVFTDSVNYYVTSCATGGYNLAGAPAWWPNLWATMVLGAGGAANAQADVLSIQVDEWS